MVAESCESYLKHLPEGQIKLTDCVLVSSENVELKCHALLLYSASPVLAGVHDTARVNGKHRVPLGADTESLRTFLAWLYTKEVPADESALEQQLRIAAKLNIQGARASRDREQACNPKLSA